MNNDKDFARIANATAYSPSGDKLGKVGQLYLDDTTNEPSFVSVKTGLFGMSESLVPMSGHRWQGDDLVLAFEKDVVKDAPNIDADQHLSEQEQDDLFSYYGRLQSSGRSSSGSGSDRGLGTADADRTRATEDTVGVGTGDTRGTAGVMAPDRTAEMDRERASHETSGRRSDAEGDTTLTRSEEQLNVGTESVETGRARLRKYTTTEEQNVTVPVSKEQVVVERTPVEGDHSGGTIDADQGEVVEEFTTREERPVVGKETVEKEQVRLGKETVTEHQTVSDQVRKEHIDVDTTGDVRR